jgi:hypothetical protein
MRFDVEETINLIIITLWAAIVSILAILATTALVIGLHG